MNNLFLNLKKTERSPFNDIGTFFIYKNNFALQQLATPGIFLEYRTARKYIFSDSSSILDIVHRKRYEN